MIQKKSLTGTYTVTKYVNSLLQINKHFQYPYVFIAYWITWLKK